MNATAFIQKLYPYISIPGADQDSYLPGSDQPAQPAKPDQPVKPDQKSY